MKIVRIICNRNSNSDDRLCQFSAFLSCISTEKRGMINSYSCHKRICLVSLKREKRSLAKQRLCDIQAGKKSSKDKGNVISILSLNVLFWLLGRPFLLLYSFFSELCFLLTKLERFDMGINPILCRETAEKYDICLA